MYIIFDIGGTKMRFCVSFDKENLQEVKILPTPRKFEEGMTYLEEYIAKVDSTRTDKAICCGLPGVLDKDKEMLISAPNLSDWAGKPLKKILSEKAKALVYLENDADIAGLGEAVKGAGRNFQIVAYMTFGTGVGGARIVDGKIDKACYGFEPGHQIISIGDSFQELEQFVSGPSIKMIYGIDAEKISDENVWKKIEKTIAVGVNNTILHWSPDVVILGGGVISAEAISIDRIKMFLKEILKVFPSQPELKKSELGDYAGLWGGLHYLVKAGV